MKALWRDIAVMAGTFEVSGLITTDQLLPVVIGKLLTGQRLQAKSGTGGALLGNLFAFARVQPRYKIVKICVTLILPEKLYIISKP